MADNQLSCLRTFNSLVALPQMYCCLPVCSLSEQKEAHQMDWRYCTVLNSEQRVTLVRIQRPAAYGFLWLLSEVCRSNRRISHCRPPGSLTNFTVIILSKKIGATGQSDVRQAERGKLLFQRKTPWVCGGRGTDHLLFSSDVQKAFHHGTLPSTQSGLSLDARVGIHSSSTSECREWTTVGQWLEVEVLVLREVVVVVYLSNACLPAEKRPQKRAEDRTKR